jgi:glutathione peroxidase
MARVLHYTPAMSEIFDVPVTTLTGEPATLESYSGKVLLIVNVASECGFTPQYAALEATYRHYKDRGFEILGFPSNDFGGQEPGTSAQIAAFCTSKFFITFPMFEKISIVGAEPHSLYSSLIAAQPTPTDNGPAFRKGIEEFATKNNLPKPNPAPGVLWNLEKFLVDRDGKVIARFGTDVPPDDPRVITAIEKALAAKAA